jgi:plastocyanin
MRLAIRLVGVSLLGTIAILACASPAGPPRAMTIKGFQFTPATLEIATGTTVTWTNEDTVPHTVTTGTAPPTFPPLPSGASPTPFPSLSSGDGKVNSGRIEPAAAFSFTFNETGTFNYFCAVHPAMKATLTVR